MHRAAAAFCSFAARKNEFFRSVTPVSGPESPSNNNSGAFARVTGNSAVFRLRSSRIGRNDRANERERARTYISTYTYARVYFDRTKRISFLAFMAPARSSFPAFDTPFRVARPEKIYRRRAMDGRKARLDEKPHARTHEHLQDARRLVRSRQEEGDRATTFGE